MKLFIALILLPATMLAQIDPARITIARDSFGVPHVFAPTDPEVAYGIAWAHAEDDFESIQLFISSGKARVGSALGKKGAEADYVIGLLGVRDTVEKYWHTMSPDFLAVVKGYISGLQAYAKAYPASVKYKNAFPLDEKDYISAVGFSLSLFAGLNDVLPKILGGQQPVLPGFAPAGSNALAFNSTKTTTGETFLAINAHQPLEGPLAFYEAHLQSEQGWNTLGGLFPGSCIILHGTNENLGWAHTVNYQDKLDVYQLEMNPANRNQYRFEGKWINLYEKKLKLHVRGIPVAISKKVHGSVYGPTVRTAKGVFSIRIPAIMDIRAFEQWYRMNKARNFSEFYKVVSTMNLPMFNIMYADRYDTIFYISNGKMPRRNPDTLYNWKSTLPGNTAATLWTEFKTIKELPQYINPPSGYLYNTNHSPFLATDPAYNLDMKKADKNDGYETWHNNRSQRIAELVTGNKIDYEYFKKIKFDRQLPKTLRFTYKIDSFLLIRPEDHPAISDVIRAFQKWDRRADATSEGAAVFILFYDYVSRNIRDNRSRQLTIKEGLASFQYAHDHMMKYFGKTGLPLGDIQKLVRGTDARPVGGLPDVLTAAYTVPYKNGMRKINSGDAYICFVRYPKDGRLPLIESVNVFGASMDPQSPHYKDQLPLFLEQRTKKMTLDKAEVLRTAERVYHPG